MDVAHHVAGCRHQHVVSIDARIAFVEVSRTDAGNVLSILHADVSNLGMHLQVLHAEDDVDAGILHLLRPADIRSFVETCQQFDDHRHFLAVAGSTDEGTHHLGVLGQAVKRGLDALHLLVYGSLL